MIGQQIEHYKIVEILGEGGMGVVYKAFDLKLERYVALKILNIPKKNPRHFIERFQIEAKNQAKLNHPNIVPIYGFVEDKGVLGIVMEYVDGQTLEDLIQAKGRLQLNDALYLLEQILTGAGFAHQKGFVHRDIKPSNIIINNEDGVAKIMDFGISKSINDSQGITQTGAKLGTILYMSPEQVKAHEPTLQSDIYSIGITFFEMLCGSTPFDNLSDYEILEAHLKKSPPKLSTQIHEIPSVIDDIILKACSKSLSRRYQSCELFLEDIQKLQSVLKNKNERKTSKEKSSRGNAKKKFGFYIFALTLFFILSSMVYLIYNAVTNYWDRSGTSVTAIANNSTYQSSSNKLRTNWFGLKSPVSNNLNSITFVDNKIGFACGDRGTVIKSTDSGKNWTILKDSSDINLDDITFINKYKGFVAGENGSLYVTNDGGTNWEKLKTGVKETLFRVYFLKDDNTGFIVGGKGTLLKTIDGGKTWNKISLPTERLLYNIGFSTPNKGIIVGWDGVVLKTQDQGNTWTAIQKFTKQYLRGVNFVDENLGFIVGGGGDIFRTDNGGSKWRQISSNTISGLYDVIFLNYKKGIILSNRGEILTSNDAGDTWNVSPSGSFATLNGISHTPSGQVFIVGSNGVILTNKK